MARIDGRAADQLRPVEIIPNINQFAEGSCLIRCGSTHVLCCASVEEGAPATSPGGGLGHRRVFHAAPGQPGALPAGYRKLKLSPAPRRSSGSSAAPCGPAWT